MNYRVDLTVLSEKNQISRFGLTLHNLSEQDLNDWTLNFTIDRFVDPASIQNAHLHQVGSLCTITPNDNQPLPANSHYYVEFIIRTAPFRYLSDGLDDAYISVKQNNEKIKLAVDITPIMLASPYSERSQYPEPPAADIAIIPKPQSLIVSEGRFILSELTTISALTSLSEPAARWLREELSAHINEQVQLSDNGTIEFKLNPVLADEAYSLTSTTQQVLIEANSHQGFIHAVASLLQLLPASAQGNGDYGYSLPCVDINDAPRFGYRGMMLDCARHFHSVDKVKRLINQLAYYKFNVFHWHLTDDEGWRIAINAYPQLTDVGAWRGPEQTIEAQYTKISEKHGGFYSQQDIKDVIRYAEQRGITIIPEIDIPGHCRAAIKSLPELLVDPDDHSQYRSIQHYTDNILSPALEGTYTFLETVLDEVCDLFPAPYVHIGADEVPGGAWTDSEKCRQLMDQHGYSDPKELQGHLLRFAEKKLQSRGKRMLGWEEAQHGDKVSKETIIYSWQSEEAGLKCAQSGYDVVMQPGQYTYLDLVQDFAPEEPGVDWAGTLPLEKTYRYEPLAELSNDDPVRQHILGIQCALWCEIINNQSRMDYMLFPRLLAIAEVCWTDNKNRNWENFLSRLQGRLPTLKRQGVNFRQQ
ncbi:family 20 glycosylhydrolase [Vibrio sp. Of7-15]|uniref:beta-N-acetylhexosaminidase n=1 Tax=Vibrio sp. Of7-15 TaxID=2724879 RepID=UPI001EF28E5E|nr:family 20 glycosylhydrolase [Vibrio sp. Of7-15]MCG7497651.1 family 20 glycosylhydrolase [Vibrio sp. Of7-15]